MKLPRRKFLYLAASASLLHITHREGADLSRTTSTRDRPVRARWANRCVWPPYGTKVVRTARKAVLRRKHGRRRRQCFPRPGPVARSESGRPKRRPRRRFPISRAPVHARRTLTAFSGA